MVNNPKITFVRFCNVDIVIAIRYLLSYNMITVFISKIINFYWTIEQ